MQSNGPWILHENIYRFRFVFSIELLWIQSILLIGLTFHFWSLDTFSNQFTKSSLLGIFIQGHQIWILIKFMNIAQFSISIITDQTLSSPVWSTIQHSYDQPKLQLQAVWENSQANILSSDDSQKWLLFISQWHIIRNCLSIFLLLFLSSHISFTFIWKHFFFFSLSLGLEDNL